MTKKTYPKNWIKEYRNAKDWTVKQLADAVGRSAPGITMLENSERRLYADAAQAIADALGCTLMEILHGPNSTITDTQQEVLQILQGMSEREQELYLSGLKAFKAAKDTPSDAEIKKPKDAKKNGKT